MTRVDFYLGGDGVSRETLACRLAETAYRRGHKVFLWVEPEAVPQWDALLWTFSDTSFVPHATAERESDEPVLIGSTLGPDGDVLIPLATAPPASVAGFTRVLEPVGVSDPEKERSRLRFRHYRDLGLTPTVHTLR